jgi:nucleotide-binding universal stress UspA family protein
MRVLVALDGSASSEVARSLVASLPWTSDDVLRFVTVLDEGVTVFGSGWAALAVNDPGELERRLAEASQDIVDDALAKVDPKAEARIESAVLRGRPPSVIVSEATDIGADLIVLGTRGRGPFQSSVLGSVSAEVVAHAPCPVLVARRPSLERIVIAEDGSSAAAVARRVVSGHPFAARPVRVVSVAHVPPPWYAAMSPLTTEVSLEAWDDSLRIQREEHEQLVETAASELGMGGRDVEREVRVGDPAGEIVAAASEWNADLIAMGTRGRTGLQRLLLGSVARNVLQHAPCSVLVARAPEPDPAQAAGRPANASRPANA